MAIECLARAAREIDAGNIEARTPELNHALAVIGELQRSLNFEAGVELAKRPMDLYDVTRCKILGANIKSSKEIIERLSGVLSSIRETWQVVEREHSGQPAIETANHAPRPASAAPAQPDAENQQLQWSA